MIKSFVFQALERRPAVYDIQLFVVSRDPLYLTDGQTMIFGIDQAEYERLELDHIRSTINHLRNLFYLPIKKVQHLFAREYSCSSNLRCCVVKGAISIEFIGMTNYYGPILVLQQFLMKDGGIQLRKLRMIVEVEQVAEKLKRIRKQRLQSQYKSKHRRMDCHQLASMISQAHVNDSRQYISPFFMLDKQQKFLKSSPEQWGNGRRGIIVSEMGLINKEFYQTDTSCAWLDDQSKTQNCVSDQFLRSMISKLSTGRKEDQAQHEVDLEGEIVESINIECQFQAPPDNCLEQQDINGMSSEEAIRLCLNPSKPIAIVPNPVDQVLAAMQAQEVAQPLMNPYRASSKAVVVIEQARQQASDSSSEQDFLLRQYKKMIRTKQQPK